jgi:solute carrier family 25 (mitochondrial S-adenosylmethionine transporter), member 26
MRANCCYQRSRCTGKAVYHVVRITMFLWLASIQLCTVTQALSPPSVLARKYTALHLTKDGISNNKVDNVNFLGSLLSDNRNFFISAAIARGISIAALFPIDSYKTLVQMNPQSGDFIWNSQLPWISVLASLYSGLIPALVGQIPYGVLTFGGYEIYKQLLQRYFAYAPPLLLVCVAAVGGDLTGSLWLCPFEVVKQQSQGGLWDADSSLWYQLETLWNNNGLEGLYQGYDGNVVRDVPFRVFQLVTYEWLKGIIVAGNKANADAYTSASVAKQNNSDTGSDATQSTTTQTLSSVQAALFGGLAGAFSAAITTPLDVTKTLLMTSPSSKWAGNAWVSAFTEIYQNYGIGGLYAGIVPRVELICLMSALFFVVNEAVLQKLNGWEAESQEAATGTTSNKL